MESFGGGFGEGFGPDSTSGFPPMGDEMSDAGRRKTSRKKGRRHKEDGGMFDDGGMYGTDRSVSFEGGFGNGLDRNLGVGAGSAIAEALGDPMASRGGPPARMSELGLGNDFRSRDEGFDRPVAQRDFSNFGTGDAAAGAGLEPVKRGFSFNMNDMPEAARRSQMQRALAPRWNPLEGIRRHWGETRKEAQVVHIEHAPMGYGGAMMQPIVTPQGYEGGPPGTLENELARTEGRVNALRTKLARLEADMVNGAQSPVSGPLRIVVDHLVGGGQLGLHMRGTKLAEIMVPEAREFGWFVGDQVLKVNGYPVKSEADFAREVSRAIDAYHMTRRPLVFDIFRPPHQPGMMGGSPAGSPYASPLHSPMGSYVPPGPPDPRMQMPSPRYASPPRGASPLRGKGASFGPGSGPMPYPGQEMMMKGMPKGGPPGESFMASQGKGAGRPPFTGPPPMPPSPSSSSINLAGNPFMTGDSMHGMSPPMMTMPPSYAGPMGPPMTRPPMDSSFATIPPASWSAGMAHPGGSSRHGSYWR